MSSRNYTIASIALVVLGSGAWWVLSGRDVPESKGSDAPSNSASSMVEATPAPPIAPAAVVPDDNSSQSTADKAPPSVNALPASVEWSASTLAFAERADPDPDRSREIEYFIQRSIVNKLDLNTYEAQSIKCRGQSCQILLVDRVTTAGKVSPTAVSTILRELNDAFVRDPGTGVLPGRPMLQQVHQETTGLATLIGFEKP